MKMKSGGMTSAPCCDCSEMFAAGRARRDARSSVPSGYGASVNAGGANADLRAMAKSSPSSMSPGAAKRVPGNSR